MTWHKVIKHSAKNWANTKRDDERNSIGTLLTLLHREMIVYRTLIVVNLGFNHSIFPQVDISSFILFAQICSIHAMIYVHDDIFL